MLGCLNEAEEPGECGNSRKDWGRRSLCEGASVAEWWYGGTVVWWRMVVRMVYIPHRSRGALWGREAKASQLGAKRSPSPPERETDAPMLSQFLRARLAQKHRRWYGGERRCHTALARSGP